MTIYILIYAIVSAGSNPIATGSVEFNTLPACRAAAAEIQKQAAASRGSGNTVAAPILMCAEKGPR